MEDHMVGKTVFCWAHPTYFYICWSLCSKHLILLYVWKNLFYLSSAAKSPASFGYTENQTILNIVSLEGSSWYMIISCVWIFSDEDDFQNLHLLFVVLFFITVASSYHQGRVVFLHWTLTEIDQGISYYGKAYCLPTGSGVTPSSCEINPSLTKNPSYGG